MNGKLNWLKASLVQRGDVLVDEELIAACHQLLSGRTWGIKPLGFLNLCNLCEIVALHERLVVVLPPDYDLTVYGGLWSRLSSAKILWCISAEEISTTYTVEQLEKAANEAGA